MGADKLRVGLVDGIHRLDNFDDVVQILAGALDELGRLSALAQGLQTPITSVIGLRHIREPVIIYMVIKSGCGVGFLKIGNRRLFLHHPVKNQLIDYRPMCVLDFYVVAQRDGIGLSLFNYMLNDISEVPGRLAYDRPSPKLVSFLLRHFQLNKKLFQYNKYLIFEEFFPELEINFSQSPFPSLY
jgi:alpha-tubulin N-acetyltransferase 1